MLVSRGFSAQSIAGGTSVLSKVFGVSGITFLLALSPALAQVSSNASSGAVAPSTTVRNARRHAPRRVAGLHPDRVIDNVTVSESNNWSGYAVTGSEFTQVKGSWIVPAVDCNAVPNSSASFWVGIDGWETDTVEQTGTDSDCDDGTPSYYAWFEFVPASGVTITSVPVSPGDQVSAEVVFDGVQFTVTMANETTGKSYRKSIPPGSAKRTSAEWIAESNGYELSDFGTVSFGQDYTFVSGTNYAADSSTSGQIGAFGKNVQESVMVAGKGVVEAVPSSLSSDGTSFTVAWETE
jgi:hypothetical protein